MKDIFHVNEKWLHGKTNNTPTSLFVGLFVCFILPKWYQPLTVRQNCSFLVLKNILTEQIIICHDHFLVQTKPS